MPHNVEIKARLSDVEQTHARARELCGEPVAVLSQHDSFFCVARGRLKLRRQEGRQDELIFYQRPDAAGPKLSDYCLVKMDDGAALAALLTQALGTAGEVKKVRTLYLSGRTRIHVDSVVDLGDFLELEVVLEEGEDAATGEAEAAGLMERLGVQSQDLVAGAYLDLLGS